MAADRRVYDSRHLQADYQEPGSAPEPYARQSSMGYLYDTMAAPISGVSLRCARSRSVSVCLSVRERISETACPNFTKFSHGGVAITAAFKGEGGGGGVTGLNPFPKC